MDDYLSWCNSTGSPPLFSYLLSLPWYENIPYSEACCHVDNFNKLFNADNLDIIIRNKDGESALHIIARREYSISTMKSHDGQLFEYFAKDLDPLSEDKRGRTALYVAAASEKTDILKLCQRPEREGM